MSKNWVNFWFKQNNWHSCLLPSWRFENMGWHDAFCCLFFLFGSLFFQILDNFKTDYLYRSLWNIESYHFDCYCKQYGHLSNPKLEILWCEKNENVVLSVISKPTRYFKNRGHEMFRFWVIKIAIETLKTHKICKILVFWSNILGNFQPWDIVYQAWHLIVILVKSHQYISWIKGL